MLFKFQVYKNDHRFKFIQTEVKAKNLNIPCSEKI